MGKDLTSCLVKCCVELDEPLLTGISESLAQPGTGRSNSDTGSIPIRRLVEM